MDNVTHSLVGLCCAEMVLRLAERRRALDARFRASAYAVAIIGNNLPDLDFSYSRIGGKTFGYLLHHRGYTHTLLAALGFAMLTMAVVLGLARWQKWQLAAADRSTLVWLAVLSPLLHIVMDFANNYGVHPFWPVYDGWLYGDSFFIVEPSFFLVLIAPISFSFRPRPVRVALWLLLGVALAVLWYEPFVPRSHAILLNLGTALLLWLARARTPLWRVSSSVLCFAGLVLCFVFGSRTAKAEVRQFAAASQPSATTLDVVVSPMPANPFCWNVIWLERDGGEYRIRIGRSATFPAWLGVDECPYDRDAAPTTPLSPVNLSSGQRLRFSAEYRVRTSELKALASARCEVRALLRFARVPYFTEPDPEGARIIGDVRYDRHPALDFADVRLSPASEDCPPYVPPWDPPRSDLLGP